MPELMHKQTTEAIIAEALRVHSTLGPGLLESAYEVCLWHALSGKGLRVERQVELPIVFEGVRLDAGYRLDLLVDGTVIVEIKAVEKLQPIHEAQLLTYLRLSGKKVGLLINFNSLRLMDGLLRRVL
jgi:GxxExxY protein